MVSTYPYRAFGLNMLSDFEVPQWPVGKGTWDVRIARGEVPAGLPNSETIWDGAFEGRQGIGLLKYPELGSFLIEGGERITAAVLPEANLVHLTGVLAGTCVAAVLYQRGGLCMHASSVAWKGRAYLIMGPSGAGKSTTASALLVRGCEFVSDDVTVVSRGVDGGYYATPSFPAVKLREDSHGELGSLINASGTLDPLDAKMRLRYGGAMAEQPLPIARICFLEYDDTIALPRAEPILGQERVGALQRSYFRRKMARVVADPQRLAEMSIDLAQRVEVIRLTRPRTGFALDELCALVLAE